MFRRINVFGGNGQWPRRLLCAGLAIAMLMVCLTAGAEEYVSSRTPLRNVSSGKLNNITLAVEAVNGFWLPYGEQFSFNEAVGPRTEEAGYREARNGRGAMVLGGGVAQVATTLYLALEKIGGITYDALSTYGDKFTDTYVENGEQAVITDYNAGTDFAFTNYADDMYIEMWVTDGYVYCSICLGKSASNTAAWTWNSTAVPSTKLISTASIALDSREEIRNNVQLACDSITDTLLYSYYEFSFNDVVGPRTEECGYQKAVNGRGVNVVGGGVAQVASVVWLAVKDLDCVEILEKGTYGERYNQAYVDDAEDAVVTDYNAGLDFRFRFVGDNGFITIYTYTDEDWLYCDIYRNE